MVVFVEFYDCEFLLFGMVADLGNLDDGLGYPVFNDVGGDGPFEGVVACSLSEGRSDDEPSVVVQPSTVYELELAAGLAFDDEALGVGLGGDGKGASVGEGLDVVLAVFVVVPWAVCLAGKVAGVAFCGEVGFSEEEAWEELEHEGDFSVPFAWELFVEVDGYGKTRIGCGFDLESIGEFKIWILDGVESFSVFGFVWVLEAAGDGSGFWVDGSGADFGGDGVPLAGGSVEAEISVGGDPEAVLDNADSALVSLGVIVMGEHDVEPLSLEVFELVELELSCVGGARGE